MERMERMERKERRRTPLCLELPARAFAQTCNYLYTRNGVSFISLHSLFGLFGLFGLFAYL